MQPPLEISTTLLQPQIKQRQTIKLISQTEQKQNQEQNSHFQK